MDEPRRHYGTDSNDEFDTIAEATEQPDGTLHFDVVFIDKRATPTD